MTWLPSINKAFTYLFTTYLLFIRFFRRMYLCALDINCAMPPTSLNCKYDKYDTKNRWRTWAKCHRYDQSIVNVLAANRWNFDNDAYHVRRFPFTVDRLKRSAVRSKENRPIVDPKRCSNDSRRKARDFGRNHGHGS